MFAWISGDLLLDVVQERDLDDRVEAREVGAVTRRKADGGIDALGASLAVVKMHEQVVVTHHRLLSCARDASKPLQSPSLISYPSAAWSQRARRRSCSNLATAAGTTSSFSIAGDRYTLPTSTLRTCPALPVTRL